MSITIRVYGLLTDAGKILITDEFRMGMKMSKFPGGGLESGEGLLDCLKREIREELGHEIIEHKHFYTTDFYQKSLFHPGEMQIINVYYQIRVEKPFKFMTKTERFNFEELVEGAQTFRWIRIEEFSVNDVDLPIDKYLVQLPIFCGLR